MTELGSEVEKLKLSEPTRLYPTASTSSSSSTSFSTSKPLIVPFHADPTIGFLYLPPGLNDFVIIDHYENLSSMSTWPNWQTPPPVLDEEACFVIRPVPGKGQGMVATRDVKVGEIVVQERPLYVTRLDVGDGKDGRVVEAAIEGLNEESRKRFLSLVNSQDEPIHPLPGRLLSNMFAVDFDYENKVETLSGGVYEFICRANQDCVPSTHYHFDFETFTGRIFAARDIPKDEEISITYAPINASASFRRSLLSRKYRFSCLCPSCTLPPPLEEASDSRRAELKRFDHFVRGGGVPSYPMLMDALSAAEVEGLASERAHVLKAGPRVIANSGQWDLALEWARKAREAWVLLEGPKSYFSVQAREQEEALKVEVEERKAGKLREKEKPPAPPTPVNHGDGEEEEDDGMIARILAAAARLGEEVEEREKSGIPDSDSDSD